MSQRQDGPDWPEYDEDSDYYPAEDYGYGGLILASILVLVAILLLAAGVIWYRDQGEASPWLAYGIAGFTAAVSLACGVVIYVSGPRRRARHTVKKELLGPDAARRKRNKRWNERLKLMSGSTNAVAASALIVFTLTPTVRDGGVISSTAWIGLAIAMGSHICGHVLLTFWRSEE